MKKNRRQPCFAAQRRYHSGWIFTFIKKYKSIEIIRWNSSQGLRLNFLIHFFRASRGSLCDCYGGRCQRIEEKSAYMVGITRDLGKQRQLIFPVVTKGNAWRVFVFFCWRKTRFRNGITSGQLKNAWLEASMNRKRFSRLDWNWPSSASAVVSVTALSPQCDDALSLLATSRLLWFIAPLPFSNHFSNCPICRALFKPAVVNEESGNWQT